MSHSTKNMTNVDIESGAAYAAVARNSENKSDIECNIVNNTSSKSRSGISWKVMLFIVAQVLLGLLLGGWVYGSMTEGQNGMGLVKSLTTALASKTSSNKRKRKDDESDEDSDSDDDESEDEEEDETFTTTTTTKRKKKKARKAAPPPPPAPAPAPMAMPSISINNANGNSNAGANTVN